MRLKPKEHLAFETTTTRQQRPTNKNIKLIINQRLRPSPG
jgi:hypothetical protein